MTLSRKVLFFSFYEFGTECSCLFYLAMVQIMYVEHNDWERTCMGHKWSEGVLETDHIADTSIVGGI